MKEADASRMMKENVELLLVEDDDDHARIVERSLKGQGPRVTVTRARDGVEALEALHRRLKDPSAVLPEAILLDLNLPKKNGHEVLSELKLEPSLRLIPIVILSTSDTVHDREKSYLEGANSYLVKPAEVDAFREMVWITCLYWCGLNRNVGAKETRNHEYDRGAITEHPVD